MPNNVNIPFQQRKYVWENEVEATTAAVLMVDKYGGKDTPGNMAVNTRLQFWHRALLLTTTTISSRLAPGRCMAGGIRHSRLVHQTACVYRHIARCVFTTIFINHKYSCSGVFNFILPSQAPYEDIQEEDCLMSPAGTKRTSQSSYVVAVSSSMCHALLDVPACYAEYRQPCIDQAPGAN